VVSFPASRDVILSLSRHTCECQRNIMKNENPNQNSNIIYVFHGNNSNFCTFFEERTKIMTHSVRYFSLP
jgi:hypothetical protein